METFFKWLLAVFGVTTQMLGVLLIYGAITDQFYDLFPAWLSLLFIISALCAGAVLLFDLVLFYGTINEYKQHDPVLWTEYVRDIFFASFCMFLIFWIPGVLYRDIKGFDEEVPT
jgi:formate hydrogenlyase subunit 3/multisubunit Na+/H+ antiporter MnhD subunit